ncbi:Protein argonaute 4A, partial [Stylosanthes scabra]|nr:Protein argonaute 4A [Stylosanthes scabra]
MELTVVLEDLSSRRAGRSDAGLDSPTKRMRRESQSKTIKVMISYAAEIPIQAIADALRGQDSEHSQEALRVLDIILRQHAAKQGCFLVRQSFFHDTPRNYAELGGGVQSLRGFHSSFRPTQGGLSLNIDVSTTMVVKPGPVLDFLCSNLNVSHPNHIDWTKAKRVLKSLRISVNNMEYKISGLSENPCRSQIFSLKDGKDENGEPRTTEIT